MMSHHSDPCSYDILGTIRFGCICSVVLNKINTTLVLYEKLCEYIELQQFDPTHVQKCL